MSTVDRNRALQNLDLPAEFEDLAGFLHTDLSAIVSVVTQRATERLLLTRRESRLLRQKLWNSLTSAVNAAVEPLSADRR
ncbi:MAG: hypothetical protein U0794_10225 [Isosphaeraceae bacterium]